VLIRIDTDNEGSIHSFPFQGMGSYTSAYHSGAKHMHAKGVEKFVIDDWLIQVIECPSCNGFGTKYYGKCNRCYGIGRLTIKVILPPSYERSTDG
jgi:DnaJ-class molecular chaperone